MGLSDTSPFWSLTVRLTVSRDLTWSWRRWPPPAALGTGVHQKTWQPASPEVGTHPLSPPAGSASGPQRARSPGAPDCGQGRQSRGLRGQCEPSTSPIPPPSHLPLPRGEGSDDPARAAFPERQKKPVCSPGDSSRRPAGSQVRPALWKAPKHVRASPLSPGKH